MADLARKKLLGSAQITWTSNLGVYSPKGTMFRLVCFGCLFFMLFDHDCTYCNDCYSCLLSQFLQKWKFILNVRWALDKSIWIWKQLSVSIRWNYWIKIAQATSKAELHESFSASRDLVLNSDETEWKGRGTFTNQGWTGITVCQWKLYQNKKTSFHFLNSLAVNCQSICCFIACCNMFSELSNVS